MKNHPSHNATSQLIDLLSPKVRARSPRRQVRAGDSIVTEGEFGASVFILLDGGCEVSVHGDVLSQVTAGEVFGEIACLEQGTRTATVRAVVDSWVMEITAGDLRAELRRSPMLLDRFLRGMAGRVRDISRREASARDEHRQLRGVLETLQPSLDRFKDHPALSIEVLWRPLSFASGDYYDVLELSPSHFLFVLGDVMGHGAATSPTVGMIRSQIHESASPTADPRTAGTSHRHLAGTLSQCVHDVDAADA
jgi:CRP-like cAMP-binding protein